MTEPVQQVRKPQIGEWWEVEQGMGYRAKYCQIYSISQVDNNSFFAKMIIEDDYLPFGFRVTFNFIHGFELTNPLVPGLYSTVEENLREIYGNQAKKRFQERLNQALAEI